MPCHACKTVHERARKPPPKHRRRGVHVGRNRGGGASQIRRLGVLSVLADVLQQIRRHRARLGRPLGSARTAIASLERAVLAGEIQLDEKTEPWNAIINRSNVPLIGQSIIFRADYSDLTSFAPDHHRSNELQGRIEPRPFGGPTGARCTRFRSSFSPRSAPNSRSRRPKGTPFFSPAFLRRSPREFLFEPVGGPLSPPLDRKPAREAYHPPRACEPIPKPALPRPVTDVAPAIAPPLVSQSSPPPTSPTAKLPPSSPSAADRLASLMSQGHFGGL